jgi:O-antigen/teichoic acid export membrane protein
VVVALLPRYLGPENVGTLRIATSIWLMAGSLITFGTDTTVTLQVARSEVEIGQIVAATVRLRLILWTVVSMALAGILALLGVDSTLALLVLILGFGAAGTAAGNVGRSGLQGLENFGSLAKASSITAALSPISIALAMFFDVGLAGIAIVLTLGHYLTAGLQLYYLRRFAPLRWRTTMPAVRHIARRGLPYLLGAVALMTYREIDTIVMAALVNEEQIGWYTTADRLFGTALVIPTVLMTAMLPLLARIHATDPERAEGMAEQTYRTLLLTSIPAGVGLALVSDRLALLLFGEEFTETGPVLATFGLVLTLVSLTTLIGRYAIAIGRERVFYIMLLAGAVATVPLDLVFVPFFDRNYGNGAIGGAASFAVTEASILIVGTAILLPNAASRPTLIRLIKVSLATLAMSAVVYPLRDTLPVYPVVAGGAAFVLATLALRTLEDHEISMLGPVLRRLPPIPGLSQR